uniref:Nonstructural protein n=1 Tax=Emberiza chrysophrys ambidensovirus TaxID=2794444 RepID=A0A8A4XCX8_9VIRU|nr:MAG: nonstructural protein [Emberiza chrysophrys ambidensovirus]
MAALSLSCQDGVQPGGSDGSGSETSAGNSSRVQRRMRSGRKATAFEEMEKVMKTSPCSPMETLCDTDTWLKSSVANIRADNQKYKNFIDVWKTKVCMWSLKDFNEFYSSCTPLFNAGFQKVYEKYYSLDESVDILSNLLLHQFNNDESEVYDFLVTLYRIIDRQIPKCNTLLVFSPPSSGKTYFFDCVLDYLWNKGQLGNPNKYNQFPFNAAEKKRILIWNEPFYEEAAIDDLKILTEGGSMSVRVKFKNDTAIYKTPLIITTNRRISLMTHPAFKDRMVQYTWRPAPFLKSYDKYPTPLAFYALLMKYNVIPTTVHIDMELVE